MLNEMNYRKKSRGWQLAREEVAGTESIITAESSRQQFPNIFRRYKNEQLSLTVTVSYSYCSHDDCARGGLKWDDIPARGVLLALFHVKKGTFTCEQAESLHETTIGQTSRGTVWKRHWHRGDSVQPLEWRSQRRRRVRDSVRRERVSVVGSGLRAGKDRPPCLCGCKSLPSRDSCKGTKAGGSMHGF